MREKYGTFERFCKLFCDRCVLECCTVDRKQFAKSVDNAYFKDGCDKCKGCSLTLLVLDKAVGFVGCYPVSPHIPGLSAGKPVSWGTVIDISRNLVDDYNAWAIRFGYPTRQIRSR